MWGLFWRLLPEHERQRSVNSAPLQSYFSRQKVKRLFISGQEGARTISFSLGTIEHIYTVSSEKMMAPACSCEEINSFFTFWREK